jgi:hypothetical protein
LLTRRLLLQGYQQTKTDLLTGLQQKVKKNCSLSYFLDYQLTLLYRHP